MSKPGKSADNGILGLWPDAPRSESPVISMADLYLAHKPIVPAPFGNDIAQLPLDIRDMFERLLILNSGEEILPAIIRVSTLGGRACDYCAWADRDQDEIATVAGNIEPLWPSSLMEKQQKVRGHNGCVSWKTLARF